MNGTWDVLDTQFQILAVCTGNVCRSPLAERLLQAGLEELAPGSFRVRSAGTHALVGQPVTPQTAALAEQLGVEIDDFRARQLEAAEIRQADLVLALDRTHRSAIVELVPQAVRKTFTLRELARFLPLVTPERQARPDQRWRSAVALAQRQRRPPTDDPGSVDVVDPFRQSDAVYQQMVSQLVPAVDALLVWEARARRPQR